MRTVHCSDRLEGTIVRLGGGGCTPPPLGTESQTSGGSKGGREGRAPQLGAQVLSISCSFRENMAKSYVGVPPRGVGAPSSGKS